MMAAPTSCAIDMKSLGLPGAFASPYQVANSSRPPPPSIAHYYDLSPKNNYETSPHIRQSFNKFHDRRNSTQHHNHMRHRFGGRYCENCDEGFYSLEDYEHHLRRHNMCPFSNCDFVGTVEVLNNHFTNDHMLSESSKKLYADTEKYREERSKKFPCSEKIAMTTEILKQRKARGELFGLNEKRKGENSKEGDEPRPKKVKPNYLSRQVNQTKCDTSIDFSVQSRRNNVVNRFRKPMPFRGINEGSDEDDSSELFVRREKVPCEEKVEVDFEISDEEDLDMKTCITEETNNQLTKNNERNYSPMSSASEPPIEAEKLPRVPIVGGLGALMAYDSSSSDEEESTCIGSNTSALPSKESVPKPATNTIPNPFASDDTMSKPIGIAMKPPAVNNLTKPIIDSSHSIKEKSESTSASGISSVPDSDKNSSPLTPQASGAARINNSFIQDTLNDPSQDNESNKDSSQIEFRNNFSGRNKRRRNNRNKGRNLNDPNKTANKIKINPEEGTENRNLNPSKVLRVEEAIPPEEMGFVKEEQLAISCLKRKQRCHQRKFKESLLSKLLRREIEHERNVLLQCTRHLVKKNFCPVSVVREAEDELKDGK